MSPNVRAKLNNPELLRWARETAGYDLDDMAGLMRKGPEIVEAWETGNAAPTIVQLRRFAQKVHRPVAALYLPDVPEERPRPVDFRMVPGAKRGTFSPAALLAFRELRNGLRHLREVLSDLGEFLSLRLPEWPNMDESSETRAAQLRETLGVSFQQQILWHDNDAALREWRSVLFDYGVVAQAFRVPVRDVRAFSMLEYDLAGVGLSTKDAVLGRVFSLFHEVAHLCLRRPGASGLITRHQGSPEIVRIEQYCDQCAASLLLPPDEPEVNAALDALSRDFTLAEAAVHVRRLKVSKYVLARRMVDTGRLRWAEYWDSIDDWRVLDAAKAKSEGGGNYYTNKVSGLGSRYVGKVLQAADRGAISLRDAARILAVRTDGLDRVREAAAGT